MKKFLVLAALSFSAFAAQAEQQTVLCMNRDVQDATLAAVFKLDDKKSTVKLLVPTGESSFRVLKAKCRPQEGSIELSLNCQIKTSRSSGYNITLFSIGGPELTATIHRWSMTARYAPLNLACE